MTETSISRHTSSADVIAFYDSQLSHMEAYENDNNGRLRRIKDSLARVVESGMAVLDVGCGTGITSRFMAQRGAEVVGVDISPKLIEFAKSKSNGHKITYLIQEAQDLDLNRTFDVIVMADVFEHIQRGCVFNTMMRLLKYHADENTKIYLNMPNYSFLLFMRENYADKLQIVDEAWKIDDVVSLFANWEFFPIAMQMYGMDVLGQYIEYLFVHKDAFKDTYTKWARHIYGNKEETNANRKSGTQGRTKEHR